MIRNHNLTPHLAKIRSEIEEYAKDMGLEFFKTIFQLVDYSEMSSIAAYIGFPNRYPHWKFGMTYAKQEETYRYGLGTIFEMVINNDPAYAYLLDCNDEVQQKLVMAHVYGHVDFFTNNYMFRHTNRKMMDKTANNATKIRRHIDRHGANEVEQFLDTVLSLENLIDPTAPFKAPEKKKYKKNGPAKLPAGREYMDSYINPKREKDNHEESDTEKKRKMLKLVEEPERDVLQFLIKHAPLTKWQRDIIDIVREEMYYFAPQIQTKILNEGWACYCHEQIMTKSALKDPEVFDFANWHSQVTSKDPRGRLNPYALGLALLRDIKERWDKGKHGKDYEECEDMAKKREWNTHENKGTEKLFEVRKSYNDITFLDEFVTQEFVTDKKLFRYSKADLHDHYEYIVDSKQLDDIKQSLLSRLQNLGDPFIFITDGNYQNKGELLLHHRWEGQPLKMDYAYRTLANLEKIWSRPVSIETFAVKKDEPEGQWLRIRCENGKFLDSSLEEDDLSYALDLSYLRELSH